MATGKASPWRMAWLAAAFIVIMLLGGALPAWTLAQDEGGGAQAAEDNEPDEPAETSAAESEDDDGDDADGGGGDAVEITTVTKTEVTKTTVSSQTADGKISEQKLSETYVKTETSGTLPAAGGGGGGAGGGNGDPYGVLLGMYERAGGQQLRTPEEEDRVDFSDFVTEGVELYYYPDVKRLMQILNPRAYEVDGVQGARNRLLKARAALEQVRRDVAEKERAVSAAVAASAGAESLLSAALDVVFSLQTQITGKQDLLESLTGQLAELAEKQASSPGDEDLAQSVKETEAAITETTKELEGEDGEGGLSKQLSNAEAKVASDSDLSKGVSNAAAKLAEARRELHSKQDLVKAYAEVENMAFAYARDNAPFWVAPALAHEPDCMCALGYDVEEALEAYVKQLEEWQKHKDKLTTATQTLGEKTGHFNAAEKAEARARDDYEFALKLYGDSKKCKTQQAALVKAKQALDAARLKVDEAQAACEKEIDAVRKAREALDKAKEKLAKAQANVGKAHDCGEGVKRHRNTDPVNHVFMFAFPDRALIILRGRNDDVRQAKRVIREFDVPAPMARVTLWTLEMNSKETDKGARAMNEAMAIIDEEFALTRAQIDAALSILRDSISCEVHDFTHRPGAGPSLFDEYKGSFGVGAFQENAAILARLVNRDSAFERYLFYEPEVLAALGFNLRNVDYVAEMKTWLEEVDSKLTAAGFDIQRRTLAPDPRARFRLDLLAQLNNDHQTAGELATSYFELLRVIVPDPTDITTLGEALLVLSLANSQSRKSIIDSFERRLREYLTELDNCRVPGGACTCASGSCPPSLDCGFQRLRRALGIDEWGPVHEGINGKQAVIVDAIIRGKLRTMFSAVGSFDLERDRCIVQLMAMECAAAELRKLEEHPVLPCQSGPPPVDDSAQLGATGDPLGGISHAAAPKSGGEVSSAKTWQEPDIMVFEPGISTPPEIGYALPSGGGADAVEGQSPGESRTGDKLVNGMSSPPATTAGTDVYSRLLRCYLHAGYPSADLASLASYQKTALNNFESAAIPLDYWLSHRLSADYVVLSGTLTSSLHARRSQWLNELGFSEFSIQSWMDADQLILREILDRVYEQYVGDNPYRQVAKGDELLKELNKAMEDELDTHFVQPMLARLRTRLLDTCLSVGVFDRTSMLVTNRKPSRIEPVATAQVALGEEHNVLQEAVLLGEIYLTAKTGNLHGVLKALGEIEGEPDTAEIYGITSGNRFVVTPVFDATGQAYRFTFDHLYTNQIRDPDGSTARTNLNLPRTESLSLNTDVQLSNFEIREVARFESNRRLGIATRESGGIPVLRDIPGLKEIPLIGWFKRRTGKAAIVQQTVIFAQTTVYPTIGDIVPLMTWPILVVGDRQY